MENNPASITITWNKSTSNRTSRKNDEAVVVLHSEAGNSKIFDCIGLRSDGSGSIQISATIETLYMIQLWQNDNWINYEKNEWKYDAHGNEVERLNLVWEDNDWVNKSKSFTEWNEANKRISSTSLRWDGNYWINQSKSVTTYTDNGDVSVHSSYDWVYGIWENAYRHSYLYNQDQQKIAYVYEFWYEHNWLKQDSSVYSYDTSAFQSLSMSYHKDMSNEWYLSERTISEYSSDYKNLVLTTQYGWNNWKNHHRDFFTVISNEAVMIDRSEEWDHEAWWPRLDIKRYYYDSATMYIYVRKAWDMNNQLRSWDSTYWVPPLPTGDKENHLRTDKLFVFPNPSDGFFRVLTDMNPQTILIYNLKGEVVYKDYLVGRKSTDIHLRFLPTGLYNIDSFDGTQRRSAKVIIKN